MSRWSSSKSSSRREEAGRIVHCSEGSGFSDNIDDENGNEKKSPACKTAENMAITIALVREVGLN